jgi:hypothetical protein
MRKRGTLWRNTVKPTVERISISPPNLPVLKVRVVGTMPLVTSAFKGRAVDKMLKAQTDPTTRSKRNREPKVPEDCFRDAQHRDAKGRPGLHASAFRNACIDACRLVGYKMTMAKMSIFAMADAVDVDDGTPLVLLEGAPEPEMAQHVTRNETGVADIRFRPMWREWSCLLRMQYDADQFGESDVLNLLARAGAQVGVGEGRPFSKNSAGTGWGTFRVERVSA